MNNLFEKNFLLEFFLAFFGSRFDDVATVKTEPKPLRPDYVEFLAFKREEALGSQGMVMSIW